MFHGFSPQTQEFLLGLAFNNDRGWFSEHKPVYEEYVKTPFSDFGHGLLERMEAAWPQIPWQLKLSRIYRDARRLFGRGPYKDHLWLSIRRADLAGPGKPAFWFSIEPDRVHFGMGIYCENAGERERYRAAIDANPAAMERLAVAFSRQEDFILDGRSYKKEKGSYPYPLSLWYNLMEFSLDKVLDYGEAVYSPALPDTVFAAYTKLMPYFEHFCRMFSPEEMQ